jgi:Tol biopolymer transport system component
MDTNPRWSPNGYHIFFQRTPADYESYIYYTNKLGGSGTRVTNDNSTTDWRPNVDPTGSRIVFSRMPGNWQTMNIWEAEMWEPSKVDQKKVPSDFSLEQNYPNPFNPTTTIKYTIPMESDVTLKISNSTGQRIKALVSQTQTPGTYEITWDARDDFGNDVSSGIYYYRIKAGEYVETKKAILVR